MLRIGICDDDKNLCQKLEASITGYVQSFGLCVEVELFYNGEDLLAFLDQGNHLDLMFLDIELGGITGIDVGHTIRDRWNDHISKIVFISGANGYDRQLFDVQPLYFLEKPIVVERLHHCMDLAIKLLQVEHQMFFYRIGRDTKQVPYQEVLYFESNLRKIKMVTLHGTEYFNGTLLDLKQDVPASFISPHGSFLVNFSHIAKITKNELIMQDNTVILISQRNMKAIRTLQIKLAKERRLTHV